MLIFALLLIAPWLFALVFTPVVIGWATRHGWLDRPSGHKEHGRAVPILGGVAVFVAMGVGLLVVAPLSGELRSSLASGHGLPVLGAGIAAMLALGVVDDLRDLRPSVKLSGQFGIAVLTWWFGFGVAAIELPFGWIIDDQPLSSFLVTVLWIVVVTNGFNLIDGLDGLAAGTGIFATLTVFVLAAGNGATLPVVCALTLAGALAGFLRYNIPPARIFLGDAGSMAIGYTIAVLSLAAYQKAPTAVVLIVPFMAVGLPLLDTLAAVARRVRTHLENHGSVGLNPLDVTRAVFRADRSHIHHLLVRLGWSVRRVLFSLYLVAAVLAGLGLWARSISAELRWGLWLTVVVGGVLVVRRVERHVLRREDRSEQELPASGPVASGLREGAAAEAAERRGPTQHLA